MWFLVGDGGPQRGPGAWDDAPDVVTPTAGRDPSAPAELVGEVVDSAWHVLVEAGRRGEVGQGVEGVAVAAVLGEDQVRAEGAKSLGHDGIEAGDPGLVVGVRLKWHVDGVTDAAVTAPLVDPSGSREEVAARFVHRDG